MRSVLSPSRPREDNSVVFLEISESGHTKDTTEKATVLGRLYFELRQDIAPLACENFLQLVIGGNYSSSTGERTRSIAENNSTNAYAKENSGFDYHLKGTFLHRIVKDVLCQGGDLKNTNGDYNRSVFYHPIRNKNGFFNDESYVLRNTGPGCLSYTTLGPNTNGSLFQITFSKIEDMDNKYVVFGCLVTPDSFKCLEIINQYGTKCGRPVRPLIISDCGKVFPS